MKTIKFHFIRSADQLMVKAFDWLSSISASRKHRIVVHWIEKLQVMSAEDMDTTAAVIDVYVIKAFTGDVYQCLCRRKVAVIGPLVVWSLRPSMAAAVGQSCPAFSACMSGTVVAIALKDKHRKQDLIVRIRSMAGKYSMDITPDVTHLVSDGNQSKKYSKAVKNGVPVVSEEWVDECWRTYQYDLMKASSDRVVHQFVIRPSVPEDPVLMANTDDGLQWLEDIPLLTGGVVIDDSVISSAADLVGCGSRIGANEWPPTDVVPVLMANTDDGLHWLEDMDDGLEWFDQLGDCFQEMDTLPTVTAIEAKEESIGVPIQAIDEPIIETIESHESDNCCPPKKKFKTSQIHMSLGDTLNSQQYVFWDFRSGLEAMTSQRQFATTSKSIV